MKSPVYSLQVPRVCTLPGDRGWVALHSGELSIEGDVFQGDWSSREETMVPNLDDFEYSSRKG